MSAVEDGTFDEFENIALILRNEISKDLKKVEELDETTSEQRLKTLIGFFKLLQSIEDFLKRKQQERENKSDKGMDVLEYRRQLEEQIAKLIDENSEAVIP